MGEERHIHNIHSCSGRFHVVDCQVTIDRNRIGQRPRLLHSQVNILPVSDTTCWTLIEGAAAGQSYERGIFAERYAPVIRAYIAARWKKIGLDLDVDDACQDVFAECFRPNGPIHRADRSSPSGFRAFLYGVVRNVARRIEEADDQTVPRSDLPEIDRLEADETSLSRVFDRAWAVGMVREAAQRQAEMAESQGADAVRRHALLQLRFQDGLPIREIARRWNIEAKKLHREYGKAKQEFLQALRDVVTAQSPMALPAEINRHCEELLELF